MVSIQKSDAELLNADFLDNFMGKSNKGIHVSDKFKQLPVFIRGPNELSIKIMFSISDRSKYGLSTKYL